MEKIIAYLRQTYHPVSVILYGSYSNGTNDENSDFDALVIACDWEPFHDTSFVDGIRLDVFVYPASYFEEEFDCEEFIQICDGKVLMDNNGMGKILHEKVVSYMQSRPQKAKAEIDADVEWCIKMLARVKRNDTEGLFRWHWVLTESLEIFCDIIRHPYLGPKKTLKWMEDNRPEAFDRYQKALTEFHIDALENWITYLKDANDAD